MNAKEAKKLERRLQRAMEKAIEAGWYPKPGAYERVNGGCCAMGALDALKCEYKGDCGVIDCASSSCIVHARRRLNRFERCSRF